LLNQIKALLSDAALRQQIKSVNSLDEAIALLRAASATNGIELSHNHFFRLMQSQADAFQLSEAELLSVAGGAPTNKECQPTQQESMCVC